MAKETVRYPDVLVAEIEQVVADADAFESKSEFHRFASDFVLTLLDPEHDPATLGYEDIVAALEEDFEGALEPDDGGEGDARRGEFFDAYVRVRRHLLYGDVEEARALVADRYDPADREAILLDGLVSQYAPEAGPRGETAADPDTAWGRGREGAPARDRSPRVGESGADGPRTPVRTSADGGTPAGDRRSTGPAPATTVPDDDEDDADSAGLGPSPEPND